jgi:hypothetical protein
MASAVFLINSEHFAVASCISDSGISSISSTVKDECTHLSGKHGPLVESHFLEAADEICLEHIGGNLTSFCSCFSDVQSCITTFFICKCDEAIKFGEDCNHWDFETRNTHIIPLSVFDSRTFSSAAFVKEKLVGS